MKTPQRDNDFFDNIYKYSEKQIRNYIKNDKIMNYKYFWRWISIYQKLSEEFIEDYYYYLENN